MIIYQGLDTKMVILDMGIENGNGWRGVLEEMTWWIVLGMASLIGGVFGLKPVREAYTPRLINFQMGGEDSKSGSEEARCQGKGAVLRNEFGLADSFAGWSHIFCICVQSSLRTNILL